ncbi:MAG: septum formation initiator family protein [Clostridia bacterium]|nr:septum formation initiator family protein [Clostridia bacterium]
MKQRPKRKKSIIVRLIVLGVSIYMVATLIGLGNELAKLNAEYENYVKEYESLKLTNEELKKLLDSGSHAEIIEKAARERLGYVYSDEEIYIDTSGNN